MWKWFAAGVAAGWVLFNNPAGNALAAAVQSPERPGPVRFDKGIAPKWATADVLVAASGSQVKV